MIAPPTLHSLVTVPMNYLAAVAPVTQAASFSYVLAVVDRWLAGQPDPYPDPEPEPPPPGPKPPDPDPPPVPAFPLAEMLAELAAGDAATRAPHYAVVQAALSVAVWA